jgi:RHS repeat-associated protein
MEFHQLRWETAVECANEHDVDTGLIYARQRYYDPAVGQWLSPDRKKMVNGPNLYEYALDRTTSKIDPNGTTVIAGPGTQQAIDELVSDPYGSWLYDALDQSPCLVYINYTPATLFVEDSDGNPQPSDGQTERICGGTSTNISLADDASLLAHELVHAAMACWTGSFGPNPEEEPYAVEQWMYWGDTTVDEKPDPSLAPAR